MTQLPNTVRTATRRFVVGLCALIASIATAVGRVEAQPAPATPVACPTSPAGLTTPNGLSGKLLSNCNFLGWNLAGADFSGATLQNAVFVKANLSGAHFDGATLQSGVGGPALATDFSFANLGNATFTQALFPGPAPVYLTYAKLTCADFSGTDLQNGRVAFGPAPLDFERGGTCRPRFQATTMSCEFVSDWPAMDLTGALGAKACGTALKGVNWSGARLDGVDFSGLDLSGTAWNGASLRGTNFQSAILDRATGLGGAAGTQLGGALFNGASVRYVDFRGGFLYGAVFSGADLEGADFGSANLPADPKVSNGSAAKFDGAHLKNVSFAGANLNSVTFKAASLYGSAVGVPPPTCTLSTGPAACPPAYPATGGTCSCATASGANLTRTQFTNAFLYSVDFSTAATLVNGTTFDGAILVNANFAGAAFSIDTSQGSAAPSFEKAMLQSVKMSAANLASVSLKDAFVDFGATDANTGKLHTSNALRVLLSSDYTGFPNWRGSKTPCVRLRYDDPSAVPVGIGTMSCPDGHSYPGAPIGCGALTPQGPLPLNPRWQGSQTLAANLPVPGWYQVASTYEPATTGAAVCHGSADDPGWFPANPPP